MTSGQDILIPGLVSQGLMILKQIGDERLVAGSSGML